MKRPIQMRWLLSILLFAAMALFIWRLVEGTSHVEALLLTDAKSNWQPKAFICPRGSNFYLVFGVPQSTVSTAENIIGTLTVLSNETFVAEISFETQRCTEASWLSKYQLQAYVLNWPTNATASRLDGRLIPGSDYQVKLDLRSTSPSGSLWFVFTQTQREKRSP